MDLIGASQVTCILSLPLTIFSHMQASQIFMMLGTELGTDHGT